MTKTTAKSRGGSASEEAKIIDYLRKNPELLMSYPEVFVDLSIPHHDGQIISLVERQLKIVRKENLKIKKKLDELVNIARENEDLNQRFHRLALELMNTDQLDDVLAMVQNQVQTFFYTDYVCFKFMPEVTAKKQLKQHYLDPENAILGTLKSWLEKRKPVCGRLESRVNRALFGDGVKIESSALIPLYHTTDIGFLCLGSVGKDRFNERMGTIFLEQLGELVSSRLQGLVGG